MSVDCEQCHEDVTGRLGQIEAWIWGPGPERGNGANSSIKSLWAAVRSIQRVVWIGTGAMLILQPLIIAGLVKWLVAGAPTD
jgi:hypothetical protein